MNKIQRELYFRRMAGEQCAHDLLSAEELAGLQWRRLCALLRHAYDRVPFYRRRFQAIGAEPEDIRTPEDFRAFPMLTRDDVLDHAEEMLACPKDRLILAHSGGSTGHPLAFYVRPDYDYFLRAVQRRVRSWLGAEGLRPYFTLWIATQTCNVPARIRPWHRLAKKHYRYGLRCAGRTELDKVIRDLILIQPPMIYGVVSILRAVAVYMLEDGKTLRRPPRVILTTAETLTGTDRELIERALGGPVYNTYGANETATIASECLARRGLHVLADRVYVEILGRAGPAAGGESGYLTVTVLDNLEMPFIRYRILDIAAWADEECPCGRPLPLLSVVHGREDDFILDAAGLAYPGSYMMSLVRQAAGDGCIRQVQFVQGRQGELEILVVPGPSGLADDGDGLARAVRGYFQDKLQIRVRLVEEIPSEPSGKTRCVKSAAPFTASWITSPPAPFRRGEGCQAP